MTSDANQKQTANSWPQTCLDCSKAITVTEMCLTGDGECKKAAYVTFYESVEPGVRCVNCAKLVERVD